MAGFAGRINNLDQCRSAGSDGKIAVFHKLDRFFFAGLLNALQQVFGCADFPQGLSAVLDRQIRTALCPRMRRDDHSISGLESAQTKAANGRFRISAGNHIGNDTHRLGKDLQSLFFILSNHAAGFCPDQISHGAASFALNLGHLIFVHADAGFINRQPGQGYCCFFLLPFPAGSGHHFIHLLLWPGFDLLKRLSCSCVHFLNIICHDSLLPPLFQFNQVL